MCASTYRIRDKPVSAALQQGPGIFAQHRQFRTTDYSISFPIVPPPSDVRLKQGTLYPPQTELPLLLHYTAIASPSADMLRGCEAASRTFVATPCQRRGDSPPAESVANDWNADPPLPSNKLSMFFLDALRQSGNSALPEQKFLCQLIYHKIKSTDMSITDFTTDNKETRVLATALDMYTPSDTLASILTESAKHSLAKVIIGYCPNYTHDPSVHFDSDSDETSQLCVDNMIGLVAFHFSMV